MSHGVTEEELEGLGPEERAALNEEAEPGDEPEEELDDPEPDPEPKPEPDDDPEPAPGPDDDPKPEPDPEPSPEASPPEPFTPQYQAEPVEDFNGQMATLITEKKELRQQYQDGDLTLDEYEDKRDEIEGKQISLREANLKATMAAEQSQQTSEQRWQWEQDRFFGQEANKIYKEDTIIGGAYNAAVKSLANDEANEDKPLAWFLEEADRQTRERFNMPVTDDGGKNENKDQGKNGGRKPGKPDTSKLPPTNLGDLPAAEQPETSENGEFAHLEKLEGMEYEAALAKLTPAQQDRYLKG